MHSFHGMLACAWLDWNNPFLRRSLSSKTLAHLLQKRYQASGCTWGMKEVRVEIRAFDAGAVGLAGAVLRILKGLKGLTNRLQCELAQGYAECLRRRGFGVVLHTTDAASVREQILELARKRFNAIKRKSGQTKARFKASSLATLLSKVCCTLWLVSGIASPLPCIVLGSLRPLNPPRTCPGQRLRFRHRRR